MNESTAEKAKYGNWIPTRLILIPGVLTLLFAGFSFLVPTLAVVAVIFFLGFLYFVYARYLFSPRGRNIQDRVQDLVIHHMGDWDGTGKVLDIGCGSGSLTIQIAKRYPQAEVTGIDQWGKGWGYSKSVCERNAKIEGVAGQISFQRASASSLPFDDEAFDMVTGYDKWI